MKLFIGGLTAAGKTTHGRLLADALQVPLIAVEDAFAQTLREFGLLNGSDRYHWSSMVDEARRTSDDIDRRVDDLLAKQISETQHCVVDAWAWYFMYDGTDARRLWIESDLPSRVRKCEVSYVRRGISPAEPPAEIVSRKDDFARQKLAELYGIELTPIAGPGSVLLSNSHLIPQPTPEASDRGIATFHAELLLAVEQLLKGDPDV